MTNIIVDPEFANKIPPLTDDEFRQLEENIVADGEVYEPIVTWNGVIVDGHNRWKIIQKHPGIPYKIREMQFADRWEAFEWMYRKQLGRRNLTTEQKTYMIGKMYEARKNTQGGDRRSEEFSNGQNAHLKDHREIKDGTSGEIGKEFGIDGKTVRRAEKFAQGVDKIREVDQATADKVLAGKANVTKTAVQALSKAEPEAVKAATEKIKAGETINVENLRNPNRVTFPSGNKDWKTKTTAEEEQIAKRDERVTNRHAEVEYTVEDLVEELTIIQNDFFQKYLLALDVHRDVALDTAKGRREVLGCVKEFEKKFNTEVKEIFK